MVGICYAHEPEIRELRRLVDKTGWAGNIRWQRFAGKSNNWADVELIVNAGFAGALDPNLSLGQVVRVQPAVHDRADLFCGERGLKTVSCHTSETPVIDRGDAVALRLETRADIVDMEFARVLRSARSHKIPLIGFKIISDHCTPDARATVRSRQEEWSKILGVTVFEFLSGLQ